MKWVVRLMAVVFLLTTAALVFARRHDSGWIVFTTYGNDNVDTLLMTGDGSAQVKPPNSEAILQGRRQYNLPADILRATRDEQGQVILIIEADGDDVRRLPLDSAVRYISEPVWSPDGAWIAFLSGESVGEHIYRVRADGRQLERLTQRASDLTGLRWSPDGEWLLIMRAHQRFADIVRVRADGSALEVLSPGIYPEYAPASGLGWHPALMIVAALGVLVVPHIKRFVG
jgi:dipeptidyl aminopeptidase/acylaminoacyl peptidase